MKKHNLTKDNIQYSHFTYPCLSTTTSEIQLASYRVAHETTQYPSRRLGNIFAPNCTKIQYLHYKTRKLPLMVSVHGAILVEPMVIVSPLNSYKFWKPSSRQRLFKRRKYYWISLSHKLIT